jgi:dTDP-glucose 4,6-dehydratase
MRMLVTGAAGFIGSNFVHRWAAEHPDDTVVAFDLLTYAGNRANLDDLGGRVEFVQGDIADEKEVTHALGEYQIDVVVNFAAESHNSLAVLEPTRFFRTNVLGTQTLLEASRMLRIQRFHHVSTCEVYGDMALDDPGAFTEESPYRPRTPYNASKAAADHVVRAYFETYGVPITISNCSNNYGPYQFPEKLIPLLIHNGLNELELPVYGDGKQIRDWLFVEDNCRAILGVLEKGKVGSIYNIGTSEERTNLDVVHGICAAIALRQGAESENLEARIRFVTDRPGHDRRYALDTTKVRAEIGWKPQAVFAIGLKQTVDWYFDHSEWISRVTSGEYRKYYDSVYAQAWGTT